MESGTYTVQATATDTSGFAETVQAAITILPAQPPTVQVTPSNLSPTLNETIIVRVQVTGNTSSIIRYDWSFGAEASTPTISTTSAQVPGVVEDQRQGRRSSQSPPSRPRARAVTASRP